MRKLFRTCKTESLYSYIMSNLFNLLQVGEFFGLQISTPLSLGVVASTLGGGVGLSLLFPPPEEKPKD